MKRDESKTKEQLTNELLEMRQRVAGLEILELEHKQLVDTLQESEEKHRALVEDAIIGIMNVDIMGKITYVNQTILQGTGYSWEELIDKNVFRLGLFSGETISVLRKRMKERLMGQPPGLLEIQFKRKDGEWIWLQIRGRVLWKHNIPVGIQIIGDNITERKQAEEELSKHRNYLQVLVDERTAELQSEITEHKQAEESLRKSEEKYRTLVEGLEDAIVRFALDGTILYCSPNVNNFGGYDSEEEIGQHFSKYIADEEVKQELQEFFQGIIKREKTITFEFRYKPKSKDPFYVEAKANPIINEKTGEIVSIQCIVRDITERKRMEEELRKYREHLEEKVEERTIELKDTVKQLRMEITERKQAEEALRRAEKDWHNSFDSLEDVMTIIDKDYNLENMNESGLALLGKRREEVIGRKCYQVIYDRETPGEYCPCPLAMRTKQVESTEHYNERFGRYFSMKCSPVFDENGEIVKLVDLYHDITERKQAEEKLREAQEQLRIAFESITDGIAITDSEIRITDINEAGLRLFGYSHKEELIGQSGLELVSAKDHSRAMQDMSKTLEKGYSGVIEHTFLTKDGTEFLAEYTVAVITDKSGSPAGFVSVMRDITERKQVEEKLRESEERYRKLIENALDIIYTVSPDGILTSLNPAFETITGWPRSEWIGKQFASLLLPDDLPLAKDMFQSAVKAKRAGALEVRILARSGEYLQVEILSSPLAENEKMVGFWGIARDITEHKRLEENLKREQQELSLIIDSSPIIVFYKDNEGRFVRVNKAFAEALQMPEEEFVEKTVFNLYSTEIAQAMTNDDQEVFQSGCPKLGIVEQYESASGIRWVQTDKVPIYNKDGSPAGLIGFAQDITERKQAEEVLNRERELLNVIMENSGAMLVYLDTDFNFIRVNRAYADTCRYKPAEMIGKNHFNLYPSKENQVIFKQVRDTGKAVEYFDKPFEFPDQPERGVTYWNWTLVPVKDAQDTVHGLVFSLVETTERKQMEEERQRAAKLESIGNLAGGIAHDFNNILTGIMGNIGLARRYVEPKSKAEDRLLDAEKASLRARDLTQQLLTFARGGAPIKTIVSISELIPDLATFALRGSNTRSQFSLPDDLWPVEADEGQLNQVITNLVINADEAMPQGGILNIEARNTIIKKGSALPLPKGNYVEITVADHGVGIPQEHLPRIFDPYFTTKQKGSGLGLATAYSIIKNHGGYISAESTPTVGTTFHIYFHASMKPMPKKEKEAATLPALLGKGRVLVMDDEEVIRELLYSLLTNFGYEVELTVDGAEAIEQYRKAKESGKTFDAVILDLTVPGGMGGKDVIKKLLEIDPGVKAIVSSGYSTDPIMSDFKDYGFSGVVAKPYKLEQLEKTLHSLLKKR